MTRLDVFPMDRGPYGDGAGLVGGWQITSYFGGRIDPLTGYAGTHGGQDMAYGGCHGTNVYAPGSGTLSQGWDYSGGGNWSGITLDDGSYVGIGHALDFAPGASYRRVGAGDLIAWCDSTGGSTGDHIHFCFRAPGAGGYSDPFDLLMECSGRFVNEPTDPTPTPDPEPDDEDDDMATPRPIYIAPGGEHWWVAPDGLLHYIPSGDALGVLAAHHEFQDAQAIDAETWEELKRAYGFA